MTDTDHLATLPAVLRKLVYWKARSILPSDKAEADSILDLARENERLRAQTAP